jgi:hypothetical protein
MEDSIMDEGPLFRPVKRRKFLRKRPEEISAGSESFPVESLPSLPPAVVRREDNELPQSPPDEEDSKDLSVAEIIRQRKVRKVRKGIEFSNSTSQPVEEPSSALIIQDAEAGKVKDMADRFTPHTGQVIDANKHMYVVPSISILNTVKQAETNEIRMEYIESELAKRRQAVAAGSSTMSISTTTIPGEVAYEQGSERTVQKQPASLGKLHEIDLGPDATMKNIARTEAAARRLDGEEMPVEENRGEKKPRLGRNGKPWRSRRRRNSDDVKRDELVEEVLRESKCMSKCPTPNAYLY